MGYKGGQLLRVPPTLTGPTVAVLLCALAQVDPVAWSVFSSLKSCPLVKAILKCHIPHEPLPDTLLQMPAPSISPITISWASVRALPFTLQQ